MVILGNGTGGQIVPEMVQSSVIFTGHRRVLRLGLGMNLLELLADLE